jgi:pheromone shutdown protein TraB
MCSILKIVTLVMFTLLRCQSKLIVPSISRRVLTRTGGANKFCEQSMVRTLSCLQLLTHKAKDSSNSSPTPASPTVSNGEIAKPPLLSGEAMNSLVQNLTAKYPHRFVKLSVPHYPNCDFFLCGTLHVADSSINMVKEVIRSLKPHYVMIELCENRLDGLIEEDDVDELHSQQELQNITLVQVFRKSFKERSFRTLGISLLAWMQMKAAKTVGSKLGGELTTACKEAYLQGSTVILGDRLYQVTIQRIFDYLTWQEKLRMTMIMSWEILTMSFYKLKDYIHKTENDSSFIQDELDRFSHYLPSIARVVISERDEYMSKVLAELARVGFHSLPLQQQFQQQQQYQKNNLHPPSFPQPQQQEKGRIVVVVGAGHLSGIQKNLLNNDPIGGLSEERMHELASSSKHASTWHGKGLLPVFDVQQFYQQQQKEQQNKQTLPLSPPASTSMSK